MPMPLPNLSPKVSPSNPKPEHEQRGIQSIEVGGQLLLRWPMPAGRCR